MVHFSTLDNLHEMKVERDSFGYPLPEFAEWRETVFSEFTVMEKLYVDFPRTNSQAVVRALLYAAEDLHLLINGGNGMYTARSFADSGREKRRRLFLTKKRHLQCVKSGPCFAGKELPITLSCQRSVCGMGELLQSTGVYLHTRN